MGLRDEIVQQGENELLHFEDIKSYGGVLPGVAAFRGSLCESGARENLSKYVSGILSRESQ